MAHRGNEDAVRILGIDTNGCDLVRVAESDGLPRFAGIGGAVHPGAIGEIFAELGLTGADVDHVRVRWGDGNRADGRNVGLAVGEVGPGLSAVGGAPDAAVHCAEVGGELLDGIAGNGDDASAAEGSDVAPLERLQAARGGVGIGEEFRVVRRVCGDGRGRRGAGRALGACDRGEGEQQGQRSASKDAGGHASKLLQNGTEPELGSVASRCPAVRGAHPCVPYPLPLPLRHIPLSAKHLHRPFSSRPK